MPIIVIDKMEDNLFKMILLNKSMKSYGVKSNKSRNRHS